MLRGGGLNAAKTCSGRDGRHGNDAIGNALLLGSQAMRSPPRTEVGFVAAVTLGAVRDIADAWAHLCADSGFLLKLSGVFCHAAPMVRFTGANGQSRCCELADLLIIVDVITADSLVRRRRAVLVQAKMAHRAGWVLLLGKSSHAQLDLYQNWYPFDFVEVAYGMIRVNFIAGGAAADSGTYGVIDRHLKNSGPPVWTQHAASPTPDATFNQPQLGEFIAEMVDGTRAGFGRLSTPSLQTDWSKAVECLLAITYARAFHHKSTLGPASAQRGVSAVACLSFRTMADLTREVWGGSRGRPPFDDVKIIEDDGEPSGISIVHLEVKKR